ncbi:MAG: PorT family protein [Bacteroidales bacterium]|nr:PorT family protein [Bacteroidales bacterium]
MKNLKLSVIIIALISISYVSSAQISAGPKLGLNMANLSGPEVKNNSMLMGFNIGGFCNYGFEDVIYNDFGKMLSVQAELMAETKGTTFETTDPVSGDKKDINYNFTYVTLPVLVKITFGESFKFYGNIGLYGSSLFGMTIDGEKGRDHDANPDTDDRKWREEYKGFDFGFIGGVGSLIPISDNMDIMIDARYDLGLNKIGEFGNVDDKYNDIKTSAISISAGLVFYFE